MLDARSLTEVRRCLVRVMVVLPAILSILAADAQAQLRPSPPPIDQPAPPEVTEEKAPPASEEDDFFDDEFEFDEQDEAGPAPILVPDPLEPINRAFFVFNDRFYFWFAKPITLGYRWVLPVALRTGISNFFVNLITPVRFTNCLLQGKFDGAATEYARFVTNTSIGILGFRNPAKNLYGLEKQEEDFGQTLGAWGLGNGFFIMIPFLGPSTVRDGLALIPDLYLSPVTYVFDSTAATIGLYFLRTVNETSFRIGDYEAIIDAALDPYEAIRDGYIQFRRAKVLK